MANLNFNEVFKCIDNDCKFISGTKYSEYQNKKELIIPLLFTELDKMTYDKHYYINKYILEYYGCSSPSIIAKFEIINDYIINNNLYPDITFKRKFEYKNISPVISNLNTDFSHVQKTIVIEMNVLSPIICGQFFENIASMTCNLDINQTFEPSPYSTEKKCDIDYLLSSLKNKNGEYITKYHKNLAMCLYTTIKHTTDLTMYYHEFILVRNLLDNKKYIEQLDKYIVELKKTIVGRLRNPKKSIKVYKPFDNDNEYISGEADLITDDMVIDIKCYKTEPLNLWKYQLEIYNNMLNRHRNKLMIINLLNNKFYTWNLLDNNLINNLKQTKNTDNDEDETIYHKDPILISEN